MVMPVGLMRHSMLIDNASATVAQSITTTYRPQAWMGKETTCTVPRARSRIPDPSSVSIRLEVASQNRVFDSPSSETYSHGSSRTGASVPTSSHLSAATSEDLARGRLKGEIGEKTIQGGLKAEQARHIAPLD
jgi:hypothetical protein